MFWREEEAVGEEAVGEERREGVSQVELRGVEGRGRGYRVGA